MKGILADVNCEGHVRQLLQLMKDVSRAEFWVFLNLVQPSFADVGLQPTDPDAVVWQRCQQDELVLITGNRNDDGPDSLTAVIRAMNQPDSLPVITIGDLDRLLHERSYAEAAADALLEFLFDMDRRRGSGRLYIP